MSSLQEFKTAPVGAVARHSNVTNWVAIKTHADVSLSHEEPIWMTQWHCAFGGNTEYHSDNEMWLWGWQLVKDQA